MQKHFKLSQFRDALTDGYLPENWRQQIKDGEELTYTSTGYLSLLCDCVTTSDDDIYHKDKDEDEFSFDEVNEVYIHQQDACTAYGENGREVTTNLNDCLRFRRTWYVRDFLEDNNLCVLENGDVCNNDDAIYINGCGYYHIDDCYFWESDNEYHLEGEEEEEENSIWGYDDGPTEKNYTKKDSDGITPVFGWGIEIEKNEMPSFRFDKNDLYDDTGAVIERDGSVSNGFELKTPVYNLLSKKTDERIEALKEFCNIENVKGAGGHIGFSMEGKTDSQLLDLCRGWLPLIYAMYKGRVNNSYCKAKKVKGIKDDAEKFQSIRLRGDYIEFRIFSAIRSYETVLFRLKLFRIIAKNLGAGFSRIISMAISQNTELYKLLRSDVYAGDEKFSRLIETAIEMDKSFGAGRITTAKIAKVQTILTNLKNLQKCA